MDKSKRGDDYNIDVRIREEKESVNRLGLRDGEGIVNASTDIENDKVKEISIVEIRDKEVAGVIVNKVIKVVINKGIKVVVNNKEEVFSAFNDSGDKDYRESSKDVIEDGEGGLSEVKVNRSDNEEYKESNREANDNEGEGLSEVEVERGNDNGV